MQAAEEAAKRASNRSSTHSPAAKRQRWEQVPAPPPGGAAAAGSSSFHTVAAAPQLLAGEVSSAAEAEITGAEHPEALQASPGLKLASCSQQRTPAAGASTSGADAASLGAAQPSPASCSLPDAPMHLLRTDIPTEGWANEGFLGARLSDLVCGDITWCLLCSYNLHARWLLSACPDLLRAKAIVLVHDKGPEKKKRGQSIREALEEAGLLGRSTIHAPTVTGFGKHHSKAFLVEYALGLRVGVLTANLEFHQMHRLTQGVFVQDFPPKDALSPPSSPFEEALSVYLAALGLPAPAAQDAQGVLHRHDFSAARAALVPSVPSPKYGHRGAKAAAYGHRRQAALLRAESWPDRFVGGPLVAQLCSCGNVHSGDWLESEFILSLSAGSTCPPAAGAAAASGAAGVAAAGAAGAAAAAAAPVAGSPSAQLGQGQLVLTWPTTADVRGCLDGWFDGQVFPAEGALVSLQPYLRPWCGEVVGRQRAMPHIKLYCRYSSSNNNSGGGGSGASASANGRAEPAWVCLTSANLSKIAWGKRLKGGGLQIQSFELGVLLLPSLERGYQASRWRGFSCTGSQALPGPCPGVSPATPVRYTAWRRGEQQAPTVSGAGVLTVPLPLPFELPPPAQQQQQLGHGPGSSGHGSGGGDPSPRFWFKPSLDWQEADEELGLDVHGLRYSAQARAHDMRYSLLEGDDWEQEVVPLAALMEELVGASAGMEEQ